jgi:hypothetical protein
LNCQFSASDFVDDHDYSWDAHKSY